MEIEFFDQEIETADRIRLAQIQVVKLKALLDEVLKSNRFYMRKLKAAGLLNAQEVKTLDDLNGLPFTTKTELVEDQIAHPPFGTNLTFPLERYVRLHQTSGTTGRPLRWLDTEENWEWWTRCWATVFTAMGVKANDRIFFAFSFGPFIGFWSAFDGACKIGALALPGGGMDSRQRLHFLMEAQATVLVSTPTYALRLAEVAKEEGLDVAKGSVRCTIHAGEPGASIPTTKRRIETLGGRNVSITPGPPK